ncbi:DUF3010 family protein [Pseudomonas rubra]|uniref:DUF3010 family protein n=1 Tax=Pseudomonas rubra TaxID=2942627 RepID=A0ABT5P1X8_9PSED|nr:DUF3010 family protein [Pseudomonas rubra]MDD1012278.1 DUF3010 family protein [Pseudomonas rubra]MDD1037375.1 DUF3010 family protein [Pseudomonas rubra]MDD1153092.1 DUF3010 family protein [Pseudomonas rubra]
MKICGIEIKGSEALLAVATLDGASPVHLALPLKKLGLDDDEQADNVKAFANQARQFVAEHGISLLAIKKRSKKGDFAGGPTTFKIEGVLQLLDNCAVELVSPQTVSAQAKKHNLELPASLNKYQHEAYKTACALLLNRR